VILPPPPVLAPPDGTAVTVTPGVAVTVTGGAVTVTGGVVTVTGGVDDTITDGDAVPGDPDVTAGDGVGLWAPDSVVACAAVPVSAIAAAKMARQPDARLMRIAISRSCSADRFVTVMSGNASDEGS
jgi:hypothetical protein